MRIKTTLTQRFQLILSCIGNPLQVSQFLEKFLSDLKSTYGIDDNCIGDDELEAGRVTFDYQFEQVEGEQGDPSIGGYVRNFVNLSGGTMDYVHNNPDLDDVGKKTTYLGGVITVERRSGDYKAFLTNDEEIWENGFSADAAVGALLRTRSAEVLVRFRNIP